MIEFKLTGVGEALENLKAIARQVSDRNLQEDGLEAMHPIVEDARSLAPVDEGDLRDSIEAIINEDGTISVIIGDWKGHFYEFGTVNHRAQPMLIPAFDKNEDYVIEMFGGRVGARIEGAVR